MDIVKKPVITVQTTVNAPLQKVWKSWITQNDIMKWNFADADWCCPRAENDLRVGGRFVYKMAAKDDSVSFDFGGTYDEVVENQLISYLLDDDRKVKISFAKTAIGTTIVESFEAESENSIELQQAGWQAILENFKRYVESNPEP